MADPVELLNVEDIAHVMDGGSGQYSVYTAHRGRRYSNQICGSYAKTLADEAFLFRFLNI